jgi:precorrin-6B methylase 2
LAKSKENRAAIDAAVQALRPGGTVVERVQALNGLAKIYESMPPLKQKEVQELARRLQNPISKLKSAARGQRRSAQAPEYDP